MYVYCIFRKSDRDNCKQKKKNCGIAWVPAYLLDCVEWQLDQNMFFKQNYPFNLSTCRNFQVIEVKFKHNDCISQQRHISVLFFVQCRELIYSISRITPHDHKVQRREIFENNNRQKAYFHVSFVLVPLVIKPTTFP